MKGLYFILIISWMGLTMGELAGQTVLVGKAIDHTTGDPIIGANVIILSTQEGSISDFTGEFRLRTSQPLPLTLQVSYVGYTTITIDVHNVSDELLIKLHESTELGEVIVLGEKVSESRRRSPRSSEEISKAEILLRPGPDIFTNMGYNKDIDIATPSLAFKAINTRGFNSTAPVRMLQLIDGVDNQSPGLNFSLGNFLGASELDLLKMEVIVGASSPFYGPNAFNGVISMETLDPFIHQGLSGMIRAGERSLMEAGLRYADAIRNKNGQDVLAYKLNIYGLTADDWKAENYSPITDSRVDATNPGGFDAVNIYGDEYYGRMDFSKVDGHEFLYPGLGSFYRTGYKEVEMVDYSTKNVKSNISLQYRFQPEEEILSPELMISSAMGSGTTVYQGDNRFSLKDILFFQHKIEFRKRDHYFLRAYYTHEDAGKSYDPYFTALRLQQSCKDNDTWTNDYEGYWRSTYPQKMKQMGYPMWMPNPPHFDFDTAMDWLMNNQDTLSVWHTETAGYANSKNIRNPPWMRDLFLPGTAEFDSAFQDITTRYNNDDGGTRFYDKSSLFHIHGEHKWATQWLNEITAGGNYRLYLPNSKGTIFYDTSGTKITNSEIGVYAGVRKGFLKDSKLMIEATLRLDKNQNFNWVQTPALSFVYQPVKDTYLRVSLSSALRNPTLSDQYLYLNVGPAILAGHIDPVDSVITINSFKMFLDSFSLNKLVYTTLPALRPERVQSFEIGVRSMITNRVYADIGYYRSQYKDFLGYVIGIKSDFVQDPVFPAPYNTQIFRYSANSFSTVITEGWSAGLNWFVSPYITLSGNYSFNMLRKTVEDDPIIPAFNTPKHKYNLGASLNAINLFKSRWLRNMGCGLQYKWVDGYVFEGSPQFTGLVPSYGQVDAQVHIKFNRLKTLVKVGATNLLNNEHYETYGGPKVGRLAYVQVRYNF